jgi:hypothetical protein
MKAVKPKPASGWTVWLIFLLPFLVIFGFFGGLFLIFLLALGVNLWEQFGPLVILGVGIVVGFLLLVATLVYNRRDIWLALRRPAPQDAGHNAEKNELPPEEPQVPYEHDLS